MSQAAESEQNSEEMIYQVAVSGKSWFAATSLGLKKSLDAGKSWQSAYASLGVQAALPTLSLAVTAGDETGLIFAGLSEGLLRSLDRGKTWQQLPLPAPAPTFSCLALSPDFARDGRLFAGTLGDGVLLYTQQGQAFNNWNFGLLDLQVLCLGVSPVFTTEPLVFAGCQSGLFRSLTGGRAWQELELPCGYEPVLSLALSPGFGQDGLLLAGTEIQGLFRSSDRGASWQPLGKFSDPVNALAFGATAEQIWVLQSNSLAASANGGATWQERQPESLGGSEITALQVLPGGQRLLVGLVDGEVRAVDVSTGEGNPV